MMKWLTRVWIAIALCSAIDASTGQASSQKIANLHIDEFGVYNAAAEISTKAHVVVDAIQPEKEPTVVLDFPGGTVADLLNSFVSQLPDYRWEEIDGVIHISRNGAHVSLLDIKMTYPGADKKTRKAIWEDIANRPEVSEWMNSANCVRQEFFHGKEFSSNNDPISIRPRNMTVEQLLDEVAVKSCVNYWAVLQSPQSNPSCHVSIILW